MDRKNYQVLENIVLAAIFFVLVQTFVEDLAIVAGWSWDVRRILILTGLGFDLFFTIEFLTRLYRAIARGSVREYIVLRRGWIDLLASVPLLLLSSGPSAIAVLMGGGAITGAAGILNVLKVVKAVRIARILRLLRVLKIFKQIKNTDSAMAQRHISKITTMGVAVFVGILLFASIFVQMLGLPTAASENEKIISEVMIAYETNPDLAESCSDLLIVKKSGETVFTRYDNDFYKMNFGFNDYVYAEYMGWEFFFDIRGVEKVQSMDNLLFFVIILALVLAYTLFYSPHFAITVSDPIHVMRRGLEEKSYNFEVKINPEYAGDDIFKLAENYNNIYLPLKDRTQAEDLPDADSLELKFDDIKNMF
ncbi:MAG: ion transporter [Spirochaetales bacterium]|uniref:Ion transporter n=1 Tax=Candidatus Thalassospirochaeta sargassi TaxID=3119039 RepID=A0AAJ1IA75_9SPIO|nr:ion transporter [Spirochaetales bacterium]